MAWSPRRGRGDWQAAPRSTPPLPPPHSPHLPQPHPPATRPPAAAGAIGLVAAPAIGAHQEGLKGFAKGAAAGLAGAVILPVTGVAVGATQLVRGAVNTPEAIASASAGKHWDDASRAWVDAPGQALVADGDGTREARARWRKAQRPGGEDDFYELLGVQPDASPEEIKRQYYLLARRLHPDKNPGDPAAKERFQRLGEAYQVLCNEELRKRYDAHGAQGLDVSFVDGAEFFTALFGSDRFAHLVGELMLAAAARQGGELSARALRGAQAQREQFVLDCLRALTLRYVEGDPEGFQDAMQAQAADLATASFGPVMLRAIGGAYKAAADIHLGGVWDGSLAALRAKGRGIKAQFSAASLALKVYQRQQEIAKLDAAEQQAKQLAQAQPQAAQQAADGEQTGQRQQQQPQQGAVEQAGGDGEAEAAAEVDAQAAAVAAAALAAAAAAAERARLEEQSLPLMLEAMWAANRLDIEATLRHVCKRLLGDPVASKDVRRRRAEALRLLGAIFLAAAAQAAPAAGSASGGGGGGVQPAPAAATEAGSVAVGAERRAAREAASAAAEAERQRAARDQMEAAMQAVMQKRMQQQDGDAP